ncbi:hypothetical protein CJF31_00006333 [Rutstroemia sp. NJR-2017a BVV2]|nr:hypothetical protein CJF31_00006333 [Rutstroemia sp. NJR-2017a BVV2]
MSRAPARPSTIVTAATEKEARRVLQWQEDVARSCSGAGSDRDEEEDHGRNTRAPSQVSRALDHPPPFRRAETFPRIMKREITEHYGDHVPSQVALQRHQVHDDDEEQPIYVDEIDQEDREKEKAGGFLGLSNKQLVGTFLGAAAGAAFAYAMVKSEDPEYQLEPEAQRPMPVRRSYTTGHAETIASSNRSSAAGGPERRYRVLEAPMPPPATQSTYSRAPQRERERDLQPIAERKYYNDRPGALGAKLRTRSTADGMDGSQADTAKPPTAINTGAQSVAPSRHTSGHRREADRSSQVSRRSNESERTSTVKAASRAPTQVSRAPTALPTRSRAGPEAEYEYVQAGPIHGRPSSQAPSQVPRRDSGDAKSRVSQSHTTIKFSPSKAGSQVAIPRSEATWERDDASSVAESSVPRNVPLPASTVVSARYGGGYREQGSGYTHAPSAVRQEREGSVWGGRDAMSVAPSDSVSSVGSKRERIERLRGRLESSRV